MADADPVGPDEGDIDPQRFQHPDRPFADRRLGQAADLATEQL